MKKRSILLVALCAILSVFSCKKEEAQTDGSGLDPLEEKTRSAVNFFAKSTMEIYYLWNREIYNDLFNWKMDEEPISKVRQIRYKVNGKDFDRWTQMTDDFVGFTSSVGGINESYGFDFVLYYADSGKKSVYCIVTYVYADSPAAEAGLKRGDVIAYINGSQLLTADNRYVNIINEGLFQNTQVKLQLKDGTVMELTAKLMYEDPVLLYKVLDADGKKVGYLHYTSFTLKSCERLIEACRFFKENAVDDVIIDLRYNGGGYVATMKLLSSMLAPAEYVSAGAVLETEVYNNILSEVFSQMTETKMSFKHTINYDDKTVTYDTEDANVGESRLWAIMASGSASASESLITCLMPYIPTKIVGEQTHGKFCSGIMYGAEEWYTDNRNVSSMTDAKYAAGMKYARNWGIYVMIGRFADKDGNTPCMPDGFTPDYPVQDDPTDPTPLGDPEEVMLAHVLSLIKGESASGAAVAAKRNAAPSLVPAEYRFPRPNFGKYILPKP